MGESLATSSTTTAEWLVSKWGASTRGVSWKNIRTDSVYEVLPCLPPVGRCRVHHAAFFSTVLPYGAALQLDSVTLGEQQITLEVSSTRLTA